MLTFYVFTITFECRLIVFAVTSGNYEEAEANFTQLIQSDCGTDGDEDFSQEREKRTTSGRFFIRLSVQWRSEGVRRGRTAPLSPGAAFLGLKATFLEK